jgi:DNA replication protein DnaC
MIFTKEQFDSQIKIWENRIVKLCKKCNGVGSIDLPNSNKAKMCECQKEALTNAHLSVSGVPIKYIKSKWKWEILNNSQDSIKKSQKFVDNFVENYQNGKGLYLYGRQGRGKSLLESLIARDVIKMINPDTNNRFRVGFIIFEEMIKLSHEARTEQPQRKKYYSLIESTDLLILDNIGSETGTAAHNTKVLEYILRKRDNNCVPTIISSNFSPEQLKDQYSDTIYDFIVQNSELVWVEGENFRQKSKVFDEEFDEDFGEELNEDFLEDDKNE